MTSAEDSVAVSEDVILAGRCWEAYAARAGFEMAIGRHRRDCLRWRRPHHAMLTIRSMRIK